MKWPALASLAVGLATGGLADPPAEKTSETKGEAVQRDYLFEASSSKRLSYALYVPTGYQASKPAPLVVLLHGLGSNPWQVIHYQGIMQEAEKRGYLVVAPYGYNEFGGYGNRGPRKDSSWSFRTNAAVPQNLGELSERDVLNVLALVCKEYAVDPKRIYLMGHSMGGGGALYLGMKYKGQWAALAALSPAIYSDPKALAGIHDTPIIIVQGDQDRLVKVEDTRRWVEAMKQLNMDYRYIEIKGGDHIFSICMNPSMITEVFDFFDQHPK